MSQWEEVTIGACRLIRGDCYALLPLLQADALIADPPYGIAFDYTRSRYVRNPMLHSTPRRRKGWETNVRGDTTPFDPTPWLHFPQIILWGANHYASRLPESGRWLVWDKREGAWSNDFSDGELAWTNLGATVQIHRQLWNGLVRRGEENGLPKLHPAQKPLALMRWCVEKTTGIVLDPFAGSFTTAVACVELGRPCIAIEIDPYHWEIGCRRIEAAHAQGHLFVPHPAPPQQARLFA